MNRLHCQHDMYTTFYFIYARPCLNWREEKIDDRRIRRQRDRQRASIVTE